MVYIITGKFALVSSMLMKLFYGSASKMLEIKNFETPVAFKFLKPTMKWTLILYIYVYIVYFYKRTYERL